MTTSTTTTLAEPLMSTNYSLRASYYCLNATGEVPETTATNPTHPKAQKPSKTTEKALEVQVTGDAVQVPRLKLSELNWKNRSRFLEMMERHSFVVLTDLGESLERVHDQVLQDFDTFFTSDDDDWKNECISKQIYRNENKTPMWYCGYEHTSVRDCFRVACGDMSRLVWPSPEFKDHWLSLQRRMEKICDRALSLTVGYEIAPSHARPDENFSVCYGLHYPNIQGSGQSETENVFEHVDPSLYVVEPVPSVEGLDVYDPHSKQWLKAEKVCVPGKEIVLFCGKALARATEGRIPGTLHRVRRTPDRRFCIIYEQKYEECILPTFKVIEAFWLDWINKDPTSTSWNWSADAKQQAMLKLASDRGANVLEEYSNSPPWWMTNNLATAAGNDGEADNLQASYKEHFALYLATVVNEARENWGINFAYVSLFNEANSKAWKFPEPQEACYFSIATQSDMLTLLRKQLDMLGLQDVLISGAEQKDPGESLFTLTTVIADMLPGVDSIGKFNAHGSGSLTPYTGTERDKFEVLTSKKRPTWDSQYADEDTTGLTMAENIARDINEMKVAAFVCRQWGGGDHAI
ncbi:hypothetical protein BBJ29_000084 [Phytophthora kernoviae]|uniref:Endo-beta-1,6-galactanase-like domain-containing protein n=1 Tax=Phytophthora kernoviae TaxID=325452 RepID=A0A3F2S1G2_9STRA|nr:hypothetical protein BBJ29_000084 [Phytophthora kernoviae]RLN68430.1 hypothetical protein BBP00_00001039 [Phytophthora kernoviae]